MRIGAVILAGGEGRRLGGGKPMQALAGRTLADHVVERVRDWGLPLAAATRDGRGAALPSGLELLRDGAGEGPIAGLSAALAKARQANWEAALTVPCDTPFLPSDLPERLVAAIGDCNLAAVAMSGGRLHPSCALWRVGAADRLPEYLIGRRSLTGFAELLKAVRVEWPVEPLDPFFNINTPEELAEAERIIRSR